MSCSMLAIPSTRLIPCCSPSPECHCLQELGPLLVADKVRQGGWARLAPASEEQLKALRLLQVTLTTSVSYVFLREEPGGFKDTVPAVLWRRCCLCSRRIVGPACLALQTRRMELSA